MEIEFKSRWIDNSDLTNILDDMLDAYEKGLEEKDKKIELLEDVIDDLNKTIDGLYEQLEMNTFDMRDDE